MATRRLVKGNDAIAYGALHAGCDCFFGYPITPQSEVPETLAKLMPQNGRVFLQAESEIASINMVYGAAGCGKRAMTSSSSPGISLMMEGISYLVGAELPCVLANVMRGGPGLGNIAPSQSDYFQAVKGGGHGDYHCIVIAPWSVQEMYEHPALAFELAEKYRTPVIILTDAILGSMLEPASIPDEVPEVEASEKPWATTGRNGREHKNVINSLYLDPAALEELNNRLQARYREMEENERRFATRYTDDAELLVVAYGAGARIALSAVKEARAQGIKAGLFRPITLFPFPTPDLRALMDKAKGSFVFELSAGQMLEDVRLTAHSEHPIGFYGRTGGVIPTPSEVYEEIVKFTEKF